MGQLISEIKDFYKRGDVTAKLIFINVALFVAITLLTVVFRLFKVEISGIFDALALPASLDNLLVKPWSILTYMFMHADFFHILFNMLWLYWFGKLFLIFFSSKHLRGLYILGGLLGGLFYIASYNIFPYFRELIPFSNMVGASASVLAIVLATAYREPNYPINLLFIGTVRLKYIALFVVLTDLLFITSDNGGGHLAHLGGALPGIWFAASLKRGTDISSWINFLIDKIQQPFSASKQKPKMKVHYGRKQDYDYNANKKAQSDEVDQILDKLKKSGYDSLTTEEKKKLFDASKR